MELITPTFYSYQTSLPKSSENVDNQSYYIVRCYLTAHRKTNVPALKIRNFGSKCEVTTTRPHIAETYSAAFYYLYNIRRIRKYLTKECTETLIHVFISSRLDYCNSLLFGVPECHLHKLQRVQNVAARLIFQESRFCHITSLLRSPHWLPVKYRIVFKIILTTFKAIHGLALAYISELISVRDTGRYDLRSNDGLLLAPCRGKTLTTLGDRSFHAAATKLWKDLPGSIRNTQSLNKFKKGIKPFFICKSFLILCI